MFWWRHDSLIIPLCNCSRKCQTFALSWWCNGVSISHHVSMTKSATNLHQHNHPLFSFRAPLVVAWSGESLCWQTHEPHVECVGCELSIGSLTSRLPEGRRLQLITITVIIFDARPDAGAGGGPTHPAGTYGTWLVGVKRTFGGQRGDSSGDETPSADCLSLTLHYVRPTLRGDTDAHYWVKVNPTGAACYFLFDLEI